MSPEKSGLSRRMRGFERTGSLVESRIRKGGEARGFAESRILTHWVEIAGPEIAAIARPVKISYGRGAFGATLTVLTTGPHAPMLEMQKGPLRDRVNAAYGYNAITRIVLTQTAATGFADGQAQFAPAPRREPSPPDPAIAGKARQTAENVMDPNLRAALEALGQNVLSRTK